MSRRSSRATNARVPRTNTRKTRRFQRRLPSTVRFPPCGQSAERTGSPTRPAGDRSNRNLEPCVQRGFFVSAGRDPDPSGQTRRVHGPPIGNPSRGAGQNEPNPSGSAITTPERICLFRRRNRVSRANPRVIKTTRGEPDAGRLQSERAGNLPKRERRRGTGRSRPERTNSGRLRRFQN